MGDSTPRALRFAALHDLPEPDAETMLRESGLFDKHRNPDGPGLVHAYALSDDGRVVFDGATSLFWQRSGSSKRLVYRDAEAYVGSLNASAFGGFDDWRLPTLEEAMSLIEREPREGPAHIDPLFAPEQWWLWTADRAGPVAAWVVYVREGSCFVHLLIGGSTYVRAVRADDRTVVSGSASALD